MAVSRVEQMVHLREQYLGVNWVDGLVELWADWRVQRTVDTLVERLEM